MGTTTGKTVVTTITQNTRLTTRIDVSRTNPINQPALVKSMQSVIAEVLVKHSGFVSMNLHRSLDGNYVVNYTQWESETLLEAAFQTPAFLHHLSNARNLIMESTADTYDVAYVDNRGNSGATTISEGKNVATFINVITTTPGQQPALLEFVVGNDARIFADAPGYRSANFHRSHDGMHVINYSHWDSEQAFLNAINILFKLPHLTMEQANRLATMQAGGVGSTNFRFYDVVFSAHV